MPIRKRHARIAQHERAHAGGAEKRTLRAAGECGEQSECVRPLVGEQRITEPDGIQQRRCLHRIGQRQQLLRRCETEQHAAIGECYAEAHGAIRTARHLRR
jgi:hypothetical protein